jgi:hypothetical protein
VQSGAYLGEDDIVRFQDNYHREAEPVIEEILDDGLTHEQVPLVASEVLKSGQSRETLHVVGGVS